VIRDQRALSVQDVLKNIAGIGLATGDGQRDQATIRGFTAQSDLFVDGLRDDALYFRDLSNVDRIEVIKGPASVLYGRGSSGGLINRVTKKPGTEGGEIVASYGSWNDRRGEVDLGHMFTDANIAARLTGAIERSDSYRDKQFLRREAIAPSLAFTPDERTTILLQADYLRDRRVTDHGIPAFQGRPVDVAPSTYYGAANARDVDFSQSEVWSTTATIDHDFGSGFRLHDALRYYDFTLDRQNTIPNIVNEAARTVTLNRQSTDRAEHGWFNQLELTNILATGPLRHQLLIGFESGRQIKNERRVNRANVATVDLFNPELPILPLAISAAPATDTRASFTTIGLYAQDLISLGSHWKALAGLRYDRFRQESHPRIAGQRALGRTDKVFSPRIGMVWQPTRSQSYYISWNRSFQPSGEAFALSAANADISPEKTINREIGAKYELFDGRISATVSAFNLKRSGIKATDPLTLTIVPIGVQRTRGIELSGQASLADGWRAIVSYAYLDAKVISSPAFDSGRPIQGKRATLTPRNSASLWVVRSFHDRVGIGGGANYVGNRWANPGNTVILPHYVTADATAWVRFGKLQLQLNVSNIFDRDYIVSGHGTSPNLNMPGAPRSAVLTARYAIN
jgi:catecholate siderophore receptor